MQFKEFGYKIQGKLRKQGYLIYIRVVIIVKATGTELSIPYSVPAQAVFTFSKSSLLLSPMPAASPVWS